ncbi:MOSC-domain-containing protein [Microthyrium microscopicum]|uniref:MOSC-domain-containing protein n=1 Tax=Microthyrium microscopicum TaxID=703497 RepID=A0A6A6UUZ9_9PEZI|nr:MOSC-domain-containing protein [Microthyrium microscopicum]
MEYLSFPISKVLNTNSIKNSTLFSELRFPSYGSLYFYALALVLMVLPVGLYLLDSIRQVVRDNEKKPPLPQPTKISDIRIYPIKSCRGISVKSATLLRTGIDLDRKWMFVDAATNKFLTIRENSSMTLINIDITEDDQLHVHAEKINAQAKLTVPAHPTPEWLKKHTELQTVEIWGRKTDGWVYSAKLTAGFEQLFGGMQVRLVLKGPEPRVLSGNGHSKHLGRVEHTMFPDVAPILVGSDSSLAELNVRLLEKGQKPITIERFRPNIIVEGAQPWNEDVWKTLALGDDGELCMDVLARCARCQVPNVEPTTGEKHKKEPWSTLMSYRRVDEGFKYKPCFGMLCAPREEGVIDVGMAVAVTDTTFKHKYISGFS